MALSFSARAQSATVRGLAALPDGVLRAITGRPVVRDGQRLNVEAQLGLKLIELAGEKAFADSTVAEARARISEDAATFAGPTLEVASVWEPAIEGPFGARLYVPMGAAEPGPLLVYYHGGGFVVGDLNTHDNLCRFLARQSGVRVLSIDYRLAPEHQFPAPFEDALAAFHYAVEHAAELGADPSRIAVGGDSAGGNLAAGVARVTATEDGPAPIFQLLFYPWVDLVNERRSYELFAEGFYLTRADLRWYRNHYLADPSQASDPRCSPLVTDELGAGPPAYVATAGFDPLRDEGEDYARRLREAGTRVALRRHRGLFHGFANTVAIGHAAREAVLEAVGALQLGLGSG